MAILAIIIGLLFGSGMETQYKKSMQTWILTNEKPVVDEYRAYCKSGAYALNYHSNEYRCYNLLTK